MVQAQRGSKRTAETLALGAPRLGCLALPFAERLWWVQADRPLRVGARTRSAEASVAPGAVE